MSDFKCPCCQSTSAKVWKLPQFTSLHWVLNPGLAVNELILGQAIPKETYICNDCPKPLMERAYLHCPTCEAFHDARIWSGKNAIGRWFGYLCPRCTQPIPRLWNLTSLLILGITMPIWWIPVQILRPKWIASERKKMKVDPASLMPIKQNINWYEMGLFFGLSMGMFSILSNIFLNSMSFQLVIQKALWTSPIWLVTGLLFGFVMKKFLTKTPEKNTQQMIYLDADIKRLNASTHANSFNQSQETKQAQYQKK